MYDVPTFKLLARNDTANAPGHQGGMVIPAALEEYFPDVTGKINPESPTADVEIDAILVVDGTTVGRVLTRYQHQTWGGTRSPERRLTGNLGPLRNQASENDLVLFKRDLDDNSKMLIELITQRTDAYVDLMNKLGEQRWGVVPDDSEKPVRNTELREYGSLVSEMETQPFSITQGSRRFASSRTTRKVRNSTFRKRLLQLYRRKCVVSRSAVLSPEGAVSLEAAHIVPVEFDGSDDPRNGLLLGKDLHWAFDKGLFYLDDNLRVTVPSSVSRVVGNELLNKYNGMRILEPIVGELAPHMDAIVWHKENIAGRWFL